MLNTLRKHTKSIFVKILFAILVLSFALWGVGDMVRTVAVGGAAIEVGDTRVDRQAIARTYRNELRRLQRALGGEFDAEQARAMGLPNMVVQQLVTQALLREEARTLGVVVTDETLRRRIAEMDVFKNELGQYDPNRVRLLLAQAGMSEAAFIETERAAAIQERLVDAVAGEVPAPPTMVETLYRYRQEQRVAEAVMVTAADMPVPEAPAEDVLRQFHQDNAEQFTAPEYRSLTLLRVGPDDVADGVELTEEMLREEFEYRRDEFQQPERRQVRQVVLPDAAAADRARNVIALGGDLQAVADEVDGEIVDLGWVEQGSLLPELEDPIFGLEPGTVSEPVESPVGWHVFAVDAVEEGGEASFEDVRDEVEAAVRQDRAIDRVYDVINNFEEAIAGGATIEEAAGELDLTVTQLRVDAQGRTPEGTPPEGVTIAPDMVRAAFQVQAGEDTGVREAAGNVFYIARVDEVTPPALRPFETVREEVLAAWQHQQRIAAARQAAREALDQVQAGAELDQVAAEAGLEVEVTDPFTREAGNGAPPALVRRMFEMEPGGTAVVDLPQGAVLARLRAVMAAEPDPEDPAMARIRQEITQGLGSDLASQYLTALERAHDVQVNRAQVEEAIP